MNTVEKPLAISIADAAAHIGIGRTKLYALIAEGQLTARKLGGRTLVLRADLDSFLNKLPKLHEQRPSS